MLGVSHAVEVPGISAMFTGGVRFHTAVVLLIQQLKLRVIFIHGFSRCRGY